MDDEALDDLEARLAALREQALEQIALSQRMRLELERRAVDAPAQGMPARNNPVGGHPARGHPARGHPLPGRAPSRPRQSARESRLHASSIPSIPVPEGESSWRTLGIRLRHRMRLA